MIIIFTSMNKTRTSHHSRYCDSKYMLSKPVFIAVMERDLHTYISESLEKERKKIQIIS